MYCNVGLSNFNEHMNCLGDVVKLHLQIQVQGGTWYLYLYYAKIGIKIH